MQCYYFLSFWWVEKKGPIVIDWILLFGNSYYTIDWMEGAGWLSWDVKGKNWCVRRVRVCTHIMNSCSSHRQKQQWLDTHSILFLLHHGILKHNDLMADICSFIILQYKARIVNLTHNLVLFLYLVWLIYSCNWCCRPEMVVGWYHSHPGFGCWLSGVDINTQQVVFYFPASSLLRLDSGHSKSSM